MPHRLLLVRREVPASRGDEYLEAWQALAAAAHAAGAHAWLFATGFASPARLEFVEWEAAAGDAARQPTVAAALALLRERFGGVEELWNEVAAEHLPGKEAT